MEEQELVLPGTDSDEKPIEHIADERALVDHIVNEFVANAQMQVAAVVCQVGIESSGGVAG